MLHNYSFFLILSCSSGWLLLFPPGVREQWELGTKGDPSTNKMQNPTSEHNGQNWVLVTRSINSHSQVVEQLLRGQQRPKGDRIRDKITVYVIQGDQPGEKLLTAQVSSTTSTPWLGQGLKVQGSGPTRLLGNGQVGAPGEVGQGN